MNWILNIEIRNWNRNFLGRRIKKTQFIQMNPIDPFLDFNFNTNLEKINWLVSVNGVHYLFIVGMATRANNNHMHRAGIGC